MKGYAAQMIRNNNTLTRQKLGEILAVSHRKYVKAQSMAKAKQKVHNLVFNPADEKLVDFLHEFFKLAKDAFDRAAHIIVEHFIYAKLPPHLRKWINQAHPEIFTYEQIVTHLERGNRTERFGSP